jgi:hypothetical protein
MAKFRPRLCSDYFQHAFQKFSWGLKLHGFIEFGAKGALGAIKDTDQKLGSLRHRLSKYSETRIIAKTD